MRAPLLARLRHNASNEDAPHESRPDGIAMMGHPGPASIEPLAEEAAAAGILMMYQNVDVPTVREKFGGGYVGANLEVMRADTLRMRPTRPFVMTNLKTREGLAEVVSFIETKGLLATGS